MSETSLEDHYKLLDVSPGATLKEIRLIYRDLAQVWHPDRFQENPRLREKAEVKLKAINQAYEAIRKSHRRGTKPAKVRKPARRKPSRQTAPTVSPDETEALGWYAKAAAEGHADSQCIIATMYAEGQQVQRDEIKALEWFRQSAAQGHAAAEYQMGLRYYSGGGGLSKDPKKAFVYYRRAALQGHAKAQFALGIMQINGIHVGQDKVSAYAWFSIASEGGNPDASPLQESIWTQLTDTEKETTQKRIAEFKQQIDTTSA